ncbi:type II toxin-antitoxin system HicB family antitoxin [bacterium]|nr:type II toxin-antitoxin system HicB family antitoxin [bacterium]
MVANERLSAMNICFVVSSCDETGGFVARWDAPSGGGICTQGESIADLEAMLRDAVEGYFAEGGKREIRRVDILSTLHWGESAVR